MASRVSLSHVLLSSAALCFLGSHLQAQEVRSPDGQLVVKVSLLEGKPTYEVTYKGKAVLESSPLGLETSIGGFASGLKVDGFQERQIEDRYSLPHGKVRDVHYRANELTCRFNNADGNTLETIFRVSDNNVALSYRLSSRQKRRVIITAEKTGFKFPASSTAFVTQQVPWGGGFAGTKPSYEEGYMMDVPVGTQPRPKLGFTFPALFRLGSDGWVLISETGVTGNYAGMRLDNPTSDGLYPVALPEKAENAGIGDTSIYGSLPFQTPWKTLTIGETLKPIVETTISTDVVQPLYEPSQTYKPGRATWSWLLWQDPSMNVKDQTAFIDLAASLGYEYILIDALWDAQIGRERMAELVKYAGSKHVGVLLWYNSNGAWNDAPQSPRNCMDTAPARHREMAWMKSIGVKGIKVDFFGGDKQVTMQLYEDILTDANVYGLMCNFHGATLPRGWERMYPNFMTAEAALVSENLVFSQGFADNEAHISTIYPFIRNPVGPMDFGPLVLNKRFSRNPERGTQRRTSDTFQLATAVLYQSPLQHLGLAPNNLESQSDHVISFLKQLPVAWDETRFVDGYPGKFVVLARRSGNRWFVTTTHAEKTAKEMILNLPWLKGQQLSALVDNPDQTTALKTLVVSDEGKLPLTLQPGGGVVLFQP